MVALLLLSAGCAGGRAPVVAHDLTIRDAFAFEAKQGAAAAAYAVIVNGTDSTETLDSVTSPFGPTSAHTQREVNGLIAMAPLERPDIPPGDSLLFQPGADHLMIEGLLQDLVAGDTVMVSYWFHRAGRRDVVTIVRPYGN